MKKFNLKPMFWLIGIIVLSTVIGISGCADEEDGIKPRSNTSQGKAPQLKEIKITTQPTKTEYSVGELLNTAGMVVSAVYSDGKVDTSTVPLGTDKYTVGDFDFSSVGQKFITIKLKADETKTTILSVKVVNAPVGGQVAKPTASVGAGSYPSVQSVTLTSEGASIYYTLDNSTPSASSTPYTSAISIGSGITTLKAIAIKDGKNSEVFSATYTITLPGEVAPPSASPRGGSFSEAKTVTLISTPAGLPMFYTLNGSTPTSSSSFYGGPISIGSGTTTLKAIAVSGANTSAVMTEEYIITIDGPPPTGEKVETPRPDWPSGSIFGVERSVSLTSATAGASIYYTDDDSEPSASSTPYTSAIVINKATTLKAIAIKAGMDDSDIMTATYTMKAGKPSVANGIVGGTYPSAQNVTLQSSTAGASIYYTTNGNDPTPSSTLYSGPITISNAAVTLKAIAVKTNYNNSDVFTAEYIIQGGAQLEKLAKPTANPGAGEVESGSTVTLSGPSGADIYYTTGSGDPDTKYTNPIAISAAVTIKAIAKKEGMLDSDILTAAYTVVAVNTVIMPAANPPAGAVLSGSTVTLSSATSGADVYYTTGAGAPDIKYTTPIPITAAVTIKAIAKKADMTDSSILTAAYTLVPPVATPTASVAGGTHTSVQNVTLSCATSGATIRYTISGTDPNPSTGTVYSSAITIDKTTTLKAIAYKDGAPNSEILTVEYTINIPVAVAPTASLPAGTHNDAQNVTLSSTTQGAVIRYTLDGTDPTPSTGTVYTSAITISKNTTLKAITTAPGYTTSPVFTAEYVIVSDWIVVWIKVPNNTPPINAFHFHIGEGGTYPFSYNGTEYQRGGTVRIRKIYVNTSKTINNAYNSETRNYSSTRDYQHCAGFYNVAGLNNNYLGIEVNKTDNWGDFRVGFNVGDGDNIITVIPLAVFEE